MRKSRVISLAAGSAVLAMCAPISRAASYTWSNLAGGTQSWTTPANWGGGGFPVGAAGAGDSANLNVNLAANLNVAIPAGSYYISTLSLGSTVTPRVTDIGDANSGGGTLIFDAGVPGGSSGTYGIITSGGISGNTNIVSAPIVLNQTSFYTGFLNTDVNSNASTYGNYLYSTQGTLNSQTFFRNVDTGIFASLLIGPASTNDLTLNGPLSQTAGVFPALANVMPSARTLTINGAIAITDAASVTAQTFTITGTTGSRTVINGVIGDGPVAGTIHSAMAYGNTNPNKTTVYPAISPTIVINGANTYTGVTTMNMATLVLGNDQPFGPAGTVPGVSGGELRIAGSATEYGYNFISDNDNRSIANGIRLGQFLAFQGSNSLTLTGYMYQTSNRAYLNLLPAGKTLTVNGSSYAGLIVADSIRTWQIDGTGLTVNNGPIYNNAAMAAESAGSGVDCHLTKSGTGTLLLNNTGNTYRGTTTVNGGLLQFAAPGSYGVQSAGFVPTGVFNGGTPTYTSGNIGTSTMNGTASIVVNSGGAVGVATGSTAVDFLSRFVAASVGALALAPADAAVNLDFTNATPGVGNMGGAGPIGMSIGAGNTPVTYTGTITPPTTGSSANTYRLGGGGTLTLPNAQLTGAGNSLVVTNGGTVVLNGLNTFGGSTTVAGSYVVSSAKAAAANDFSGAQGDFEPTVLAVSHLGPASAASSIGSSSSGAGNLVLNGGTLKYTGAGDSTDRLFTMSGAGATLDSSGTGAVTFSNTGAVVQTDAPATSATLTVGRPANQGAPFNTVTLPVGTDLSQLAVGMTVTDSAGALAPYAPVTIAGISGNRVLYLSFQPNASYVVPTNDSLSFTVQNRALNLTGSNTGANTLAAALTDSAAGKLAVNKSGTGTWVLSGTSTYTGNTTATGGIVEFTTAAGYGNTASIRAGANSAVGVDTGSTAAGFLAKFTASSTPSTGALALAASDAAVNLNFTSGALAGPNLVGMSVGALPAGVSYTGTITPAASTYRLGGGGALTLPNTNALTGANNVVITNGGVVALTGSNDYSGTTTVQAGNTLNAVGSITISSSVTVAAGGTLNVSASLPTAAPVTASGNVNFTGSTGAATLTHNAGAINITSTGHVAVLVSTFPFTPAILNATGGVTFAVGTTLDVTNNELIVPGTLSSVVSQITGGQIVTTASGGGLGSLDIGSGNVEVRFTLLGDTNLDGKVDVTDLGNLASNYGAVSGATWVQGDTNYTGAVDVTDLGNLASNYGGQLAAGPSAGGGELSASSLAIVAGGAAAVPEPASLGLLALGAAALLPRRRRN